MPWCSILATEAESITVVKYLRRIITFKRLMIYGSGSFFIDGMIFQNMKIAWIKTIKRQLSADIN